MFWLLGRPKSRLHDVQLLSTTSSDGRLMLILVYMTAGARFAMPLDSVQEIVRAVSVRPLPGAPPVIAGLVNYRGLAVAVFDLRVRFGAPAAELNPNERFVIARTSRRTVALRVDEVDWIREAAADDVQEVTDLTIGSPYLTGIIRVSDDLLFIHDLEAFLSEAEENDLEESLTEWNGGYGQ